MLILQGISFVLFLLGAVLLAHETISNLSIWRKIRPSPSDKFADAVQQVMIRVRNLAGLSMPAIPFTCFLLSFMP